MVTLSTKVSSVEEHDGCKAQVKGSEGNTWFFRIEGEGRTLEEAKHRALARLAGLRDELVEAERMLRSAP